MDIDRIRAAVYACVQQPAECEPATLVDTVLDEAGPRDLPPFAQDLAQEISRAPAGLATPKIRQAFNAVANIDKVGKTLGWLVTRDGDVAATLTLLKDKDNGGQYWDALLYGRKGNQLLNSLVKNMTNEHLASLQVAITRTDPKVFFARLGDAAKESLGDLLQETKQVAPNQAGELKELFRKYATKK